jgi:nitrate reductase gamma subunit
MFSLLLNLNYLLAVVIPYVSITLFIGGIIYKVLLWGKSAVPFKIPSTCGQEKSLNWIKYNRLESPFTKRDVFWRMLLEILLFRSLFRNSKMYLYKDRPKVAYFSSKWLWLFAIVFHYSFLIVLIRHLRLFTVPVPSFVHLIEKVDSFFEIGVPYFYLSGILLFVSALLLLLRRTFIDRLRYISLPADYLPLLLLLTISITGIIMRYFYRVDVVSIKELTMSLVTVHPVVPTHTINGLFYVHLFSVSIFFAYLPFSKLIHGAGLLFSPTRNLPNNSRAVRHINPWNPPVKVHTYEEYEEEFRDKMKKAGLPLEKE